MKPLMRGSGMAALGVAAGLCIVTGPGSAAAASPVVVRDVQASTDPYGANVTSPEQPNTEVEPSIAVNPGDPNDVVTAFQEGRVDAGGDKDNGFGASLDAGQTWTYGNLPGLTTSSTPTGPFDRASDAAVAFGKDPTGQAHGGYLAYVNSLVFDDSTLQGLPSGMAVNVSSDGGLTWSTAAILQSDNLAGLNDKNWIVVDNGTGTGHHPGRVYVFWDKVLASLAYAYCDPDNAATVLIGTGCDKAANWTSVANTSWYQLSPTEGIGAFPVVLIDGGVGVVFFNEFPAGCNPNASPTDQPNCALGNQTLAWTLIPGAGGAVWPGPLPASQVPVTIMTYDSNGVSLQRAGGLPQAAVDPNTDEVYVAWESDRFRTDDGATPGDSDTSNQNDAVVAYSMPDATTHQPGVTWSAPIRVNADAPDNHIDHYNTTLAIGQDSILRVAYRQRSEPSGADLSSALYPIDSYYQEAPTGSTVSGSFSAPLKVDTSQNTVDPQFGAFSRFGSGGGLFQGDYEQIAAAGTDESYFTRDETWPATSGATCHTGLATSLACQNQQTWVAFIAPQPGTQTPETRFVAGFVLIGAAAGMVVYRRRRWRRGAMSAT